MNESTDLIHGKIWKAILWFSIPMLVGNLFQQLYNTVDSYVVGNFVSSGALAAVGQSTPIINTLVGFFTGLATGAGVVIAQYFGGNHLNKMKKAIHTSIALTLILCVLFTILGIGLSHQILVLIGSPDSVMAPAALYLRIYFGGISFVCIYNMGSGILRAVGDSKTPLYYLIVASIINIILDFVFVLYFHMGVAGAGWATFIAQGISALLVIIKLVFSKEIYKVEIKEISIDKPILKKIIEIGIPTALQQSIVSFSNVIVQSYINTFGANAVAGYTSYIKIDGFLQLPIQSFAMAITTFTGQNIGAHAIDRVKKGLRTTMAMTFGVTLIGVTLVYLFGEQLVGIFSSDPEVIKYGYLMARIFAVGYLTLPVIHIISGALRGVGLSNIPMYFMVGTFVFLRQIYLAIAVPSTHNIGIVFAGWPVTWIVCMIGLLFYYFRVHWLDHV
ncbi:MATE family efflux transporter [uncultured Catenibacterium sp.]|uniref:MATE family efflux transporter n=1 Tax=uncultured Catenibacterium sp. TaxID=286142 RepID=UPI0025E1EC93|nr:MATE family efflux transporter [uncultured Catenibacterium sp.]